MFSPESFFQAFFSFHHIPVPVPLPFLPTCEQSYQSQYQKNYKLLRNKYKTGVLPMISFFEVFRTSSFLETNSLPENGLEQTNVEKIYCFLVCLAFYEVDNQKTKEFMSKEDWNQFALSSKFLSQNEVFFFRDEIFRRNAINYPWTTEEDFLLQTLYEKHKNGENSKTSWLAISKEFNGFPFISQTRSPAHCQERWKNTLKMNYRKGNWDLEDDKKILEFVIKSGTKWSKLAKVFEGRTEHNMKNRFFSILSRELKKTIREIKRNVNYRSPKLLRKIIAKLD